MPTRSEDIDVVRAVSRGNVFWAAVAAALMLYYGAYCGLGADPPEDWEARLRVGSWGVFYTLQIGGVLMVLSALLSLTGTRTALLFDSVASICIGAALVVTGALLLFGIAMQPFLLILFGAFFIHSGYRSWGMCRSLRTLEVFDVPMAKGIQPAGPVARGEAPTETEDADAEGPVEQPEEGHLASFAKKPYDND